MQENGIKISAN